MRITALYLSLSFKVNTWSTFQHAREDYNRCRF